MNRDVALAHGLVQSNKKSAHRKADDTGDFSSSTTSAGSDNYDVFLSFSGRDTRKTLADHLYNGLVDAGIRVFRDNDEIREGEKIGPNILQAIKNSKISIPILSRNYASSKWCLQELTQMVKCVKSIGHVVLPLFYRVEPAHVRHQIGSFGETFSHLSTKYLEEDVVEWKQALKEVASLKGWESEKTTDGYEGNLVKMVVRKVLGELKKAFQLMVPEQLIGIDNAVEDILRLLDNNPNATQIVGIHGMGGIGKTTLAKVIYNKLSNQFQHRSFLADIRDSSQRKGISCLQNQLISDILKMNEQVSNTDEGIRIMESRFKCKKVLLLLDDVDHNDQLKALVGKHDWFGMGSKVIITTRIRSVLDEAGVKCKYEPKEIDEDQSLILFSRHAFLRNSPPCEFESLSRAVVSTAGGLPLALEVIGSFLCGRNSSFWQDALRKLKKVPHTKVQEKLRISYDSLNYEEKQIFLDIACLFVGESLYFASHMWNASNFYPMMGIEILCFMSLIKIGDYSKIKMHDQLRDLGREIVRQEDHDVPKNRSRLWIHKEALEVLERNKGIQKDRVKALRLPNDCLLREFTTEQFETLPNLRFLEVHKAGLLGDSKGLLPELRWLTWIGCPTFVPTRFSLKNLVQLNLSRSPVSEFWKGWIHLKVAKQLKCLFLDYCSCLRATPNLSAFRHLESFSVEGCENLNQIHPSIGEAKGLFYLDLQHCRKLKELPQELGKLEELRLLYISDTAVKEIPPCISSLKKLEVLFADDCTSLIGIPHLISHLVNLSTLDMSNCFKLCKHPDKIIPLMNSGCLSLGEEGGLKYSKSVHALNYIPNSIGKLEQLNKLDLSCSGILELPESIGDLKNLKILNVACCKRLSNLPCTISKLGNLEELDATECESLGGKIHIYGLSSMKVLRLSLTGISGFPDAFDKLSRLEILDLCNCPMLQLLPQSISKLPSLQHLMLANCDNLQLLPELPSSLIVLKVTSKHRTLPLLSHLIHLEELAVVNCLWLESMPKLPSGLLELHVHNCDKLEELPCLSSLECLSELDLNSCRELTEIKGLQALKSLAKLDLTGCSMLSNIDGLEHVKSLRSLCISGLSGSDALLVNDDLFQVGGLGKLKSLEELQICHCQSLIRPNLLQLTHLKQLSSRECHNLVEFKGLERLKNLERLEIQGCRSIETLPDLSCFYHLKYLDILGCSKLHNVQGLEKVTAVLK